MEIYLDIVVILNFLVDFFLILATNRISGHGPGIKKAALASVLGAAYAAGCILPGFRFLSNILWRIISFAIMSLIAFGWDRSALRRGVLFIFLSLAMGGIAMGIGNGGFWAVVMAALLVCLLCRLGFGGRPGQQHYIPVTILHNGKTLHLTALVDTGNTVLVIEHNLDVIKVADHIIDLGPDGGDGGGQIVATGTPEDVAQNPNSFTGQYLKKMLHTEG